MSPKKASESAFQILRFSDSQIFRFSDFQIFRFFLELFCF